MLIVVYEEGVICGIVKVLPPVHNIEGLEKNSKNKWLEKIVFYRPGLVKVTVHSIVLESNAGSKVMVHSIMSERNARTKVMGIVSWRVK